MVTKQMSFSRFRCVVAAWFMSAVMLAGCSQAGMPSITTPSPSTSGHPYISGTLSVSGQFAVTAAFTTRPVVEVSGLQTPAPPGTSCAGYAGGYSTAGRATSDRGFDPPPAETRGTPNVSVFVALPTGYKGPGTYVNGLSSHIVGTATVAVETAQGPFYVFRSSGGMTSFAVSADGSGSLTFAGWPDTEKRGGNATGTLDGTITWTCK